MKKAIPFSVLVLFSTILSVGQTTSSWNGTELTLENKPWTRWWWMGSTLTKEGITKALEEYNKAGIGGLEITPIYGVKGYEEQFVAYLSPEWIYLFKHTLKEAKRLNLGIDMATGTGWPFGGPWIDTHHACKNFSYTTYSLKEGQNLKEPVSMIQKPYITSYVSRLDISDIVYPVSANKNLQKLALEKVQFEKPLPLITLMAYSKTGEKLDLTNRVSPEGILDWTAPKGEWTVYAIFMGWHGKMVERAAPGGEGNVIDHYSKDALQCYLNRFDSAFHTIDISYLRAFFNDSYEVDDARGEANFTPLLFEEFKTRKGYDLRNYLDIFLSEEFTEEKSRIVCDYREVISDMLLDNFTRPWSEWARTKDAIIRNQAHGSPANILDLYAASDIPETEGQNNIGMKFASSAAHVTGKQLISSETATWLDEHFKASLADVKKTVDNCFLSGINHIVYHGTTYSPEEEQWPGWMFYAAVNFAPSNTFWKDFHQLNTYVTRCQSFLQQGNPVNHILLYYPIYDKWSENDKSLIQHFKSGQNLTQAENIGERLYENGYSFDYISDKQLQQVTCSNNVLKAGTASYRIILVPETQYMPEKTFNKLMALARQGAIIIFEKHFPLSVPGFYNYKERQEQFNDTLSLLKATLVNIQNMREETPIGKGIISVFNEMTTEAFEYIAKDFTDYEIRQTYGLDFICRTDEDGNYGYFIVNRKDNKFNGKLNLTIGASQYITIYYPMNGAVYSYNGITKSGIIPVNITLQPGESCIVKPDSKSFACTTVYPEESEEPIQIGGAWTLTFITGGPSLPREIKNATLQSWTKESSEAMYFSGTAKYGIDFKKPDKKSGYWILDLGEVHESAVIYLNGENLCTLICKPYQLAIFDTLLQKNNTLEIEVTNLMANRIIYMEKEGINYKKFYNVNFPPKYRENMNKQRLFDASQWEPMESGLLGPVTLTPAR